MRIHLRDALLCPFILTVSAKLLIAERDVVSSRTANITQIIPTPLIIPPSQYWDGIDGLWSSFALRVGTPSQDVRVLVSTNSPVSLVVLPLGCTSQAVNPVPDRCANSRGGLFNNDTSTTWQDQGLFGINQDGVGLEANLGYFEPAEFGLDTLGLGFIAGGAGGPTLHNQTVGGIATASPLYLGIFGLGTQPLNFSTIGNYSAPSYFTALRSQQLIPSLSWSFTAGAKYQSKDGQYAQLIFGGYDTSRYTPNSASFSLNDDINRDIVVAIQSITYSGTTQSTLLSTPIFAFIESTDPNIWLPEAACEAFEQAFGLKIDNSTGLYLINSTQYTQLQQANPQVTFTLSNSLSGGETVDIVLPFSAFGLPTLPPFTPNATYYFPLKKAANDSQNTLGRVFLQEAYLTVDYERHNFSVSQCVFVDGAAQQIGAILSPSYASNSSNSTIPSTSPSKKPVGAGVIVGGVIGGLVVLILAAGLGYIIFSRRKHSKLPSPNEHVALASVDLGCTKDSKEGSMYQDPNRPYSPDKKLGGPASVHRRVPSDSQIGSELDAAAQIHQLPTEADHQEGDYFTAVNRMASERRAEATPQLDGNHVVYELLGSPLVPIEMDDERSRQGLALTKPSPVFSPMSPLSPITPITPPSRGSSRPSNPGTGNIIHEIL